ncbi:uncharacterized protein LOC125478808 isoform X1 [Pyrus x bretschneideri]|uniref:uncharacterized protein LOC125478808 isoform X1 n=1 Tax=Pyrus x bretschneideri TaxID=225117 RepID=UPI00202F492E|nr:uncharacterized protein LOC125478808 isoform X1 [Pyrus x bretschneideri]XP_048443394.1 uncharacterized protein LOC125478808 isoform X1 [Pyrus x bretschneideri]
MADYEPPSFSLGLHLGFDSQLQPAAANHSTPAAAPNSSRGSNADTPVEVDEEFEPQITGPDPDPGSRPGRPLKWLKRGVAEKREPTPGRRVVMLTTISKISRLGKILFKHKQTHRTIFGMAWHGCKSSKKGRIKSGKSNVGTVEHASGNWVEPRSCVSTKRVQANAQPSSQWDAFGGSGQAAG